MKLTEKAVLLPDEDVARIVHEACRAYQNVLADPYPIEPWDALDSWRRETVITQVKMIRMGLSPEMIQDAWVRRIESSGWTWGITKDPMAMTHPGLVPWESLPPEDKKKVMLAFRIVYVLDFEGE